MENINSINSINEAEVGYEQNRFHLARFEIGKIDEPVDIAAAEYATQRGWDWTQGGEAEAEYEAFMEHYRSLHERSTKECNLVAAYFGVGVDPTAG